MTMVRDGTWNFKFYFYLFFHLPLETTEFRIIENVYFTKAMILQRQTFSGRIDRAITQYNFRSSKASPMHLRPNFHVGKIRKD